MSVKFGIIGSGFMAATMLPAIRLSGAEVVGVSSRDKARAAAFAKAHGLSRAHESVAAMLADKEIDAVYVASATGAHAGDAIAALEAGKHILCEKPFAMNAQEGARVLAAAKSSGRLFMEALWTHFLPAYQRFHGLAHDEATLGAPVQLMAAYGYPATENSAPRLFDEHDGGVILDLGVYPVSLALRVMGPIASVTSWVARNKNGVDTHFTTQFAHENGAVSQLAASFDGLMNNAATLSGARGAATLTAPLFGAEEVVVEHFAPSPPAASGTDFMAALKRQPMLRRLKRALQGGEHHSYGADKYLPQMKHFLGLISAGKTESDVASHALSLETVRILDQIRAQG